MRDVSHVREWGQYLHLGAYGADSATGHMARGSARMPRRWPQRFGILPVLRPPVRRPRHTADPTCPRRLRWCAQLVEVPSAAIAGLDGPPAGTYVFRHRVVASVETISIFMPEPSVRVPSTSFQERRTTDEAWPHRCHGNRCGDPRRKCRLDRWRVARGRLRVAS